jgi:hypothetical protein
VETNRAQEESEAPSPPWLFRVAGRPKALALLAAMTLLCGAAMLPAMATMADHGASILDFESAGSVAQMHRVLDELGDAGKAAAWWQLAIDMPFIAGYGLFLAGACAAVARRAERAGMPRLRLAAVAACWLGPAAATLDLLQNISLAFVLSGHVAQPWPWISALGASLITILAAAAALFALAGAFATRGGRVVEA